MSHDKKAKSNPMFHLFIEYTISNIYIHYAWILFEYYPIFLTSSLTTYFLINPNIPKDTIDHDVTFFWKIFPFRPVRGGFTIGINIIIFIVFLLFIMMFFIVLILAKYKIIPIFSAQSNKNNKRVTSLLMTIFVNFYDLLFFRYLSIYIIWILCGFCKYNLLEERTWVTNALGLFVIVVLVGYISLLYYHNNNYYILININNAMLSKTVISYPFDIIFTKTYNNALIWVKLITSVEYIYFNYTKTIDFIILFLSFLHVLLLFMMTLHFGFHVTVYRKIQFFWFNSSLHIIRMIPVLFNFYYLILVSIWNFHKINEIIVIIYAIISLIWAATTWLLFWVYNYNPLFYNEENTKEKWLYLIINENDKNESKVEDKNNKEILNFKINTKELLRFMIWNHQWKCILSSCKICSERDKSTSSGGKTTKAMMKEDHIRYVTILKQLSFGDNTANVPEELETFYSELVFLIYYSLKKKTYKFYRYYISLIKKYTKSNNMAIINNLHHWEYVFTVSTESTSISGIQLASTDFTKIYEITEWSMLLSNVIIQLKEFLNYPKEWKHVSYFFKYSKDLSSVREHLKHILEPIQSSLVSNDSLNKDDDSILKIMGNPIRYNLIINRYIMEIFLNKKYKEFIEIDMELLEDFIDNHYKNDNFLLIHNNIILKSGKDLNTFNGLDISELFPARLSGIGKSKLEQQLGKYTEAKGNFGKFEFIIKTSWDCQRIEYFAYYFKIAKQLVQNSIMLIGNYKTDKNVLLFQKELWSKEQDILEEVSESWINIEESPGLNIESNHYENPKRDYNTKEIEKMKLINYSLKWKSWLLLRGEWLDILANHNNAITFSEAFSNIKNSISRTSVINNPGLYSCDYDCEVDYKKWFTIYFDKIKFLKEYFNQISYENTIIQKRNTENIQNDNESMKKTHTKMEEPSWEELDTIMNKLKTWKDKNMKKYKVKLSQLMSLNKWYSDYYIYTLKLYSGNSKTLNIKNTTSLGDHNDWEEQLELNEDNNNEDYHKYASSNTSMTDMNSLAGKLSSNSSENKNKNSMFSNDNGQHQANSMSKSFAKFSILILFLNVLLIFLCFFFLIIQIQNISKLLSIYDLFYMFKRIRLTFANSYIALFPNYCIAETGKCNCENKYQQYINDIIKDYSYSDEDRLEEFSIAELRMKIDIINNVYNNYKPLLNNYGDKALISTLYEEMVYVSIGQSYGKYEQSNLQISLEEGIHKFTSSVYIWLNSEKPFNTIPFYLLSMNKGIFNFTNILTPTLTEAQLHLYWMVVNFVNYSSVFNKAENLLIDEYTKIQDWNQNILVIYITVIAWFNVLLLSICLWQLVIVKRWFFLFIFHWIRVMDNPKFIQFYQSKFNSLLQLTLWYVKNPNYLIKKIKVKELELINKELKNKKTMAVKESTSESKSINSDESQEDLLNKQSKFNHWETAIKADINSFLIRFLLIIVLIFSLFFIFLIAFDIIILIEFLNVKNIVFFIREKLDVELNLYNNSIILMMIIYLNWSEIDVAMGWGIEPVENLMNKRIRDLNYEMIQGFNAQFNEKMYIKYFKQFNSITCSELMDMLNDTLITSVSLELNYDFVPVRIKECERYNIIKLEELKYWYFDYNYRISLVWNNLNNYDHDEWFNLLNTRQFYDWMHLGIFLFQPCVSYLRKSVLENLIKFGFSDFQTLLIIYLVCTICSVWIIFIIIKYVLVEKLTKLYTDLRVLDSCFEWR